MATVRLVPSGRFELRETALFGFGQRHLDHFDGVLRLAMCRDGSYQPFGAAVRQHPDGMIEADLAGGPGADVDPAAARRQLARVLSLDRDASAFARLADDDPVLRRLRAVAPGLLPPLFHSPYEAAVWAILSARVHARQAAVLRSRLSEGFGCPLLLAGESVSALPAPRELLAVPGLSGLPTEKLARLQGVARAALDGLLDVDRLRALDPAVASAELQTLRGIGPFSASLIVVRSLGHADVLPLAEERVGLALVGELYGLSGPATPAQLVDIAQAWRPFRTWALVLVRAAAGRLAAAPSA